MIGFKKVMIGIFFLAVFAGCGTDYTPRPRGYIRIDFPEKKYERFDSEGPFAFDYPVYGQVVKDTRPTAEPYWFNVVFPKYKATIHLTYKPVKNNLFGFTEDTYKMTSEHISKADDIRDLLVNKPEKKVYGIIYEVEGNAASSIQFYLTDSVRHFIRGALYFEAKINKDSLAPAIDFFKKDVRHLIETFNWKN